MIFMVGKVFAGGIGILLLVAVLGLVGTACNAALVALVWNVLLHSAFSAGTLNFWECVGVGFGLTMVGL